MKVLKGRESPPNVVDVVEGGEDANDEGGSEDVEKGPKDVDEGLNEVEAT